MKLKLLFTLTVLTATALFAQAVPWFAETPKEAAACLSHEATAWQSLASIGVDPLINYEKSIALYSEVLEIFAPNSPEAGSCLMNQATALKCLAEMGVDTREKENGTRKISKEDEEGNEEYVSMKLNQILCCYFDKRVLVLPSLSIWVF